MTAVLNLARPIAAVFTPVPDFITLPQLSAALGVERPDHKTTTHIREWMQRQGWQMTVRRVDGLHVRGYIKAPLRTGEHTAFSDFPVAPDYLLPLLQAYRRAGPDEDAAGAAMWNLVPGLRRWMGECVKAFAVPPALSRAAGDVLAERFRQVASEGWTPEHDDGHVNDEIAAMACFYAMPPGAREWSAEDTGYGDTFGEAIIPEGWAAKEGDRRRELVKAGALILAEIERMDRAESRESTDA